MASKTIPEGYLFSKGYTYYVFSLICLLMLFDFADRMIISSLLPLIKKEWNLTDAQSGGLISAVYWCMFLFVVPVSILVDRWSRRKAMFIMSSLWSIACAAGAFVTSYAQLWVTRAFIGVGESAYAPAATTTISALFPEKRRAMMIGVFNGFISIGMMVGMMLGAAIAVRWGWRHALGVVALPGLIVTVLIYFTREYKTVPLEQTTAGDQRVKIKKSQIIGNFFRKPSLIAAYVAFAAQSFVYVSLITFSPTFYVRVMGLSLQKAAVLSSAALPVMIFAGAIGGWAVDRWMLSNLRARLYFPTIAYLLAALFNIIAFGFFSGVSVTYVFIFAMLGSLMLTAAGPACMAITQEVVHPGVRAMSYGVGLVFQHLLGSAPGPLVTGALSDKFGLPTALTCAGAVSLVAAVVLFFGSYSYIKDRDSVEKVTITAEE